MIREEHEGLSCFYEKINLMLQIIDEPAEVETAESVYWRMRLHEVVEQVVDETNARYNSGNDGGFVC